MNSQVRLNSALLRLIVVQICIHGSMSGVRMAAPLLALRQGYSAAAVGVLLALFALAQVFLSLPAGRYADRNSLKRPVGLSVAFTVFGVGLAVIWPVFPVLCLAALFSGGATGCAVIALQRHVGRMASDALQLRRVFSWLAVAPSLANFVGPFSAGLLIDHAGFRVAFAAMAVLPLLSWYLVRNTPELPLQDRATGEPSRRTWDLLGEPQMRRLLLINWLLSSCWDVHTFILPVLGHERGFSASVIGTILGVFAVATTVVRMAMPMIAGRLQEWAVITAAMAATALLFGIYPLLHAPLAMGFCSMLLGLALGSVQPMILSTMHQITPAHRHGEALGLRMLTITSSGVLMPLLFGTAGAIIGVASVFWVVGATVAGGTRAAWRLKPRAKAA
jgi:MFS family permease